MIEIVSGVNSPDHQDILEGMFRLRYEIVVGELDWSSQQRADRRDVDQFDTDETTYVISIDEDRNVLGASRLLSTVRPHMMSELFSNMCRGGAVPRGDHILELSRLVVRRDQRYGNATHALGEISVGEIEHALSIGVSYFTMVTEVRFFPRFLENGWRVKMLGLPEKDTNGTTIAAASVEFDEDAVFATRERHNVWHDVLHQPVVPPAVRPQPTGPVLH